MIQCHECSKDVAEDAAHCGHCGAKVISSGGKTMFGMGAISPEMMEKAAAEVAAAKEAAAGAAGKLGASAAGAVDKMGATADAALNKLPTPGLNLPKPTVPSSSTGLGEESSSSVFELNAPGTQKPLDPFAPSEPVKVFDVEETTSTVNPGSLGSTPAGAGDPAWAGSNAPQPMPKASPANAALSNVADSVGGSVKEAKSKMPLVIAGGCLLVVFAAIFAFVFFSFIWPIIAG